MVVQLSNPDTTSGSVSVFVVSPSTQSERSFPLHMSIAQVKSRLQLVTGINVSSQRLALHQPTPASSYDLTEGAFIAALDNEDRTLSDYGVKEGDIIKVSPDSDTLKNSLYTFVEDPNVKKFELTDEEYAGRRDTVMAYKARNKIGRFADAAGAGEASAALPSDLTVGARVKVIPATESDLERIGTIKFVGSTDFAPGVWIGVHYDEPVGRNDGSVEGKRYFECPSKYGGFVKPERCQAGNWASLDDDLELDSE